MSKRKPESRSRQQDQLDLKNIINLIENKFPFRNLLYIRKTNHFTQILTIGLLTKLQIDDCFYIPHTLEFEFFIKALILINDNLTKIRFINVS